MAVRTRDFPDPRVVAAVAAGGFVGGVARYAVGRALPTPAGGWPWATLLVNLTGAFALALLVVLVVDVWRPTRLLRPFLGIGVIGAYTTFGTWMVEVDRMVAHGSLGEASAYLTVSIGGGLLAAVAGVAGGRLVARRRRAPGGK